MNLGALNRVVPSVYPQYKFVGVGLNTVDDDRVLKSEWREETNKQHREKQCDEEKRLDRKGFHLLDRN